MAGWMMFGGCSADNKITKELMQTIELYNSVNGSFTHTSPMGMFFVYILYTDT